LTVNSSASLSLSNLTTSSFNTSSHQSWTIINGSAGTITGTALNLTGVSGTFTGLGSFSYSLGATALTLDWTATAIPEPSTYAALCGAAALGCAVWHRRRHRQKSSTATLAA
jgi:hypothetical protein